MSRHWDWRCSTEMVLQLTPFIAVGEHQLSCMFLLHTHLPSAHLLAHHTGSCSLQTTN